MNLITTVRHAELVLNSLDTVRTMVETIQKNRAAFPNLPLLDPSVDFHLEAAQNMIRSQELKEIKY